MKATTPTFKEIMATGKTRDYEVKITLTLADETEIPLTEADIWSGSFSLETATSSTSSFDLGCAVIGKCSFALDNFDERFNAYDFFNATAVVELKLKGDTTYYRMGFFTVDEPTFAGALINLELLDNMWKFDVPLSEVNITYSSTTTIFDIVSAICSHCGVILATQDFHGKNFVISEAPKDDINCREMLQYVAMIGCNFCVIDSQGNLNIRWYNTSDIPTESDLDGGTFNTTTTPYSDGDTADGGDFLDYTLGDTYDGGSFTDNQNVAYFTRNYNTNIGTDVITITGLKITIDEVDYTKGEEGYMLEIENPLITSSNVTDALNSIWDVLEDFRLRIFSVDALSDISVEVGDCCAVMDLKGNYIYSYVTNMTQTLTKTTASLSAVSPTRTLTKRYSKTVQTAVQQARRQTGEIISNYDLAVQMMNALAVNAIGAYQDYEDLSTGGRVYYLSNMPITKTSGTCSFQTGSTVFKISGDGFFVSTDAGVTWVNGYNAQTGQLVVNVLNAIGINAEWIKTGIMDANLIRAGVITDNTGNNYWDLDNSEFRLSAGTTVGGSTVQSIANAAAASAQNAAETYANTIVNSAKADLQSQIDGNITSYFEDYVPTMSNYPVSEWSQATSPVTEYKKHIGDLFYDGDTGYCYRFQVKTTASSDPDQWTVNDFEWVQISDEDIAEALAVANAAQDTADHKRRVFITTPTVPYDAGDLWCVGETGDILTCVTPKTVEQVYSITDWQKKNKYVDSRVAGIAGRNYAIGTSEGVKIVDGVITEGAESYKISSALPNDVVIARDGTGVITATELVFYFSFKIKRTNIRKYDDTYYLKFYIRVTGKKNGSTVTKNMGKGLRGEVTQDDANFLRILSNIDVSSEFDIVTGFDIAYFVGETSVTGTIEIKDVKLELFSNTDWCVASEDLNEEIDALDDSFDQDKVFNRLTNYQANQGIYLSDGSLYINASKIATGILDIGGSDINNPTLRIKDSDGHVIGTWTRDGIEIKNSSGTTVFKVDTNGNVTVSGYATNSQLSNYATTAGLANGSTTINGGCITTGTLSADRVRSGTIQSNNYSDSGAIAPYSYSGMKIDLATGNIRSPFFALENASKGTVYSYHILFQYSNILLPDNSDMGIDFDNYYSQLPSLDHPNTHLYQDALRIQSSSDYDEYGKVEAGVLTASKDYNHYIKYYYYDVYRLVGSSSSNVRWDSGSDRRIKKDIKDIDTELSIELIDRTEPKSFKYIETEGTHYGMIAQDVRVILDDLGEEDAQLEKSMGIPEEMATIEDQRTIDYEEYIPHLINYVKDLRAELDAVKAELKALKGV